MSGGYFDYNQFRLNEIIESLEELQEDMMIMNERNNEEAGRFEKKSEVFEKILPTLPMMVRRLKEDFLFIHQMDLLLSGDIGEDTYLEAVSDILDGSVEYDIQEIR